SVLVLATAAGLICGLLEALWLCGSAAQYFDGPGEALRLVLVVATLGAAAGAALGAVEALLWRALRPLPSKRRALVTTLLAAPAVAWVCLHIFAGPQARPLPLHSLLAVAIGVAALAAIYYGQEMLFRVPTWLFAALTVGLYAADQKVLPRLYPFFHQ